MADGIRPGLKAGDDATDASAKPFDGANAQLRQRSSASQLAAADPRASVWVSANAGTGKTYTLTSRVARLLLNGTRPEHILCLTFTRAAAAQMQTKLYERLGEWSTMPEHKLAGELAFLEGRDLEADEIAKARRLFASALETPGGLKIQTIHAFCESLLGRFPLEAGVSPHFALADDRQSAELLAEARDQVLQQTVDAPETPLAQAMVRIAGVADEAALEGLLTEVSSHRHKLARWIDAAQGIDGAERAVADALSVPPGADETSILADAIAQLDMGAVREAMSVLSTGSTNDKKKAKSIAAFLNDPTPSGWLTYFQWVFLKQNREGRTDKDIITKSLADGSPHIKDWLIKERSNIVEAVFRCRAAQTSAMTCAVLRLGHGVLAAYEALKTHHALLDYDDLITRTAQLLSSRTSAQWVLYKLDRGLDHVLVDEAQDTSPQQWKVIEALVQEFFAGDGARAFAPDDAGRMGVTRTLFAVGDEKQSIFSFQGAEPGTFAQKRQQFRDAAKAAEQTWRDLDLTVSWRTAQEILDSVDAVFEPMDMRQGVVAGNQSADKSPIHHESVWTGRAGLVEVWPAIGPQDAEESSLWDAPLNAVSATSPLARLADRITDAIAGWIGTEMLPQRGRTMQAGDILILVRRRNALVDELIRKMKEKDIPVAGVDRLVLGDHIAVMDLMALARFALLPEDDLTLATVLRSPLCDIDETGLFALAHDRGDATLWETLKNRRAEVPGASAAYEYLTDIRNDVGRLRPHEFFSQVLGPRRGREALVTRLGMDAHDPIDEFLNQTLAYEATNTPSLQDFVAWMDADTTQIKRDLDQSGNKVRIMTVHGAKGLEANVVILPDTIVTGAAGGRAALLTHETGLVTYSPSKTDADAASAAAILAREQRDNEEYRRLLYVAMTRAMDRLYIAAYHGKTKPRETSWYERVYKILEAQPHAKTVDVEFADGPATVLRLESPQKVAAAPDKAHDAAAGAVNLPDWVTARAPADAAPMGPLAPSLMPSDEEGSASAALPPALSPLTGFGHEAGVSQRFARGRLIHTLLQHLPDIASRDRRPAALAYLKANADPAFDASACEGMADEVMAVLDDPKFAPLFAPGSRAEVALAGRIMWKGKSVPVAGQIDRLAVTQTTVMIADYKTNRPPPADVKGVAQIYIDQMAAYRALVAAAYPGRQVRCALVWTDGPRLMDIPDSLLIQQQKTVI